jgi:hypothetical protein
MLIRTTQTFRKIIVEDIRLILLGLVWPGIFILSYLIFTKRPFWNLENQRLLVFCLLGILLTVIQSGLFFYRPKLIQTYIFILGIVGFILGTVASYAQSNLLGFLCLSLVCLFLVWMRNQYKREFLKSYRVHTQKEIYPYLLNKPQEQSFDHRKKIKLHWGDQNQPHMVEGIISEIDEEGIKINCLDFERPKQFNNVKVLMDQALLSHLSFDANLIEFYDDYLQQSVVIGLKWANLSTDQKKWLSDYVENLRGRGHPETMKLKNYRSLYLVFMTVLSCASLTHCSFEGEGENNPKARLTDYINTSFNVKDIKDKEKLVEYLTGSAKNRLVAWSDEQFRQAFVDTKRKFSKLTVKEVKNLSPTETNITYELSYLDQTRGIDAQVTNKKMSTLTQENGKWYIKEVKNIKEVVEYQNELSLP